MYANSPLTFTAGSALEAFRRVKLSAGTVVYAGLGEQAIGVTLHKVADTLPVSVQLWSSGGTLEISTAKVIAVDAVLYGAASGQVSDASSGSAIGVAKHAVSGADEILEVLPYAVLSTTAGTVSIADAGNFTAQATVEAATQEIYQHIKSIKKIVQIPIGSFVDVAATQLTTFSNGASAQPGLELTNSKAFGIRWNNHGTPLAVMSQFTVPHDADITANMTLKIMASKVGATIGDAVTFTIAAYNQVAAALHEADTDYGGASGAMTGDATSKTVQVVSRTLGLADLPAVSSNVTLTIKPTAGTLGTDDVCIHAVWVEYKGIYLAS
jgi:hypothetical protein